MLRFQEVVQLLARPVESYLGLGDREASARYIYAGTLVQVVKRCLRLVQSDFRAGDFEFGIRYLHIRLKAKSVQVVLCGGYR